MQDMAEASICSLRYVYIKQLVNLQRMVKNTRIRPCSISVFYVFFFSLIWNCGFAMAMVMLMVCWVFATMSVCALDYSHLDVLAYSRGPCLLHPMYAYLNICCVCWSNGLYTHHRERESLVVDRCLWVSQTLEWLIQCLALQLDWLTQPLGLLFGAWH